MPDRIDNEKQNKLAPRNANAPGMFWRDFDDIFEQFRNEMNSLMFPSDTAVDRRFPATNVTDDGANIVVESELPGLAKEDVSIEVTDKYVEISGERKTTNEEKDEKKKFLRQEMSYTAYSRKIPIPEKVKHDQVKASMKDGVLKIVLPKVDPGSGEKSFKVKIE